MIVVLCLNDFPIGVYDDEAAAEAAKKEHAENLNNYLDCDGADRKNMALHYHSHPFQLNSKARI